MSEDDFMAELAKIRNELVTALGGRSKLVFGRETRHTDYGAALLVLTKLDRILNQWHPATSEAEEAWSTVVAPFDVVSQKILARDYFVTKGNSNAS